MCRRYEGLGRVCKQMNPSADLSAFVHSLSAIQDSIPITKHIFSTPIALASLTLQQKQQVNDIAFERGSGGPCLDYHLSFLMLSGHSGAIPSSMPCHIHLISITYVRRLLSLATNWYRRSRVLEITTIKWLMFHISMFQMDIPNLQDEIIIERNSQMSVR